MIRTGIRLEPLDVAKEITELRGDNSGAIVTFEGLTRPDVVDGRVVVALEYEAHESLAEKQLSDLAEGAGNQWPGANVVVLHRIGTVRVGEPSVLIVVATKHRSDAFDACEWLIDTVKEEVAIWKKELFDDGSGRWVGTPTGL